MFAYPPEESIFYYRKLSHYCFIVQKGFFLQCSKSEMLIIALSDKIPGRAMLSLERRIPGEMASCGKSGGILC